MKPRAALIVLVILGPLLTGCYRMYWTKPGGDLEAFTGDHQACLQGSATPIPRKPGYGVLDEKRFRACMHASGWSRQEITGLGAKEGGWFRSVEDEDIVRLDVLPEQPNPWAAEDQAAKEVRCRQRTPTLVQFKACMEHKDTAPVQPSAMPARSPEPPPSEIEQASKETVCRRLWPNDAQQFEICLRQ